MRCRRLLVVEVHSDALYLLLTQLTPLFLSSRPRAHLPLPTPLSWLPFPIARHCDAAATVVVPESLVPWTHFIFLVLVQRLHFCCQFRGPGSERILAFELLTSYFFLWPFSTVTVGRGFLPKLVGDSTVENTWGAKWIPRLLFEIYTILWFEFDLCG